MAMNPQYTTDAGGEVDIEVAEPADHRVLETARARRSAKELLSALMAERALLESRAPDGGKTDPMKRVTGRSAMENAIASTRDMIAAMDQLLSQLRSRTAGGSRVLRERRQA